MQANRLILLTGALAIALMASACNPVVPSRVNTAELRVREQTITKTFDARHVDRNSVAVIAEDIKNNNNPDVSMTIPYTRGGYAAAVRLGAAYKRAFADNGVVHFSASPVLMAAAESQPKAVLSYQGLVALPPDGCTQLPVADGGASIEESTQYRYGCAMQTELGKEIVNPADLLGRAPRTQYNSRRNGTIIEPYMSGTPNKPIKGMEASQVGG